MLSRLARGSDSCQPTAASAEEPEPKSRMGLDRGLPPPVPGNASGRKTQPAAVHLPPVRAEGQSPLRKDWKMAASRWVHLDFDKILQVTDKAMLVRLNDDHNCEEVWLPFSQIANPDDYEVADRNGTISIAEWLAKEKGLD